MTWMEKLMRMPFLRNGELLNTDLTEPFAMQDNFPVGYYELIALAKDDAGNVVAHQILRG